MKLYAFITFLFLYVNANAQIKSGELIYSLKRKEINLNKKSNEKLNELKTKIFDASTKLEFYLHFNDSISKFGLKKSLSIDIEDYFMKMAILSTRGNNTFLYNRNNKTLLEKTELGNEIFIIKKEDNNLVWNFSKEQKRIGGYLCFKATTEIITKKHTGEDFKRFFTVWYSPEIPFNYGPFNIVGIPGLVLEFSDNTKIYTISSIKLSKEELKINSFQKGKVVTTDEFNNIVKRIYNDSN